MNEVPLFALRSLLVNAMTTPTRAGCGVGGVSSASPSVQHYPEAGLSILRRAYLSRGGPICPEAGLSVPRRVYLSQGGPMARGGSLRPEAGLSHGTPEEGLAALETSLQRLHDQCVRPTTAAHRRG